MSVRLLTVPSIWKHFERKLKDGSVRLISMAYTSNLTGYTIPAKDIVETSHRYGARVLFDAAQTAPHQ